MNITKTFNNINFLHIVRNCTSERCSHSIHAHNYKVAVTLEGIPGVNDGMVMDFGLFKGSIKKFLEIFKGAYIMWDKDKEVESFVNKNFDKIIYTNFNPTAENLSVCFYNHINEIIKHTKFNNGEDLEDLSLKCISVNETRTGQAVYSGFDTKYQSNHGVEVEEFSIELIKGFSDDEVEFMENFEYNENKYWFENPIIKQQVK